MMMMMMMMITNECGAIDMMKIGRGRPGIGEKKTQQPSKPATAPQ
jgi:hypothetical protein